MTPQGAADGPHYVLAYEKDPDNRIRSATTPCPRPAARGRRTPIRRPRALSCCSRGAAGVTSMPGGTARLGGHAPAGRAAPRRVAAASTVAPGLWPGLFLRCWAARAGRRDGSSTGANC